VHDWLGGYPYESISPEELRHKMKELGFQELRSFTHPAGLGLFGTGCDEFVFSKLN
jgi:2-polyprenyl-6-hydroxyphenyl methylase/3-demethylubiquinone-9 3-methyltransferase